VGGGVASDLGWAGCAPDIPSNCSAAHGRGGGTRWQGSGGVPRSPDPGRPARPATGSAGRDRQDLATGKTCSYPAPKLQTIKLRKMQKHFWLRAGAGLCGAEVEYGSVNVLELGSTRLL
jgi:hypothetical protein